MRLILIVISLFISGMFLHGQPITLTDSIRRYFIEIKRATQAQEQIWKNDLYGPILFVQPATRTVFANYADSAGVLTQTGLIYTGHLPPGKNIANTAIEWNGRRWAMVMLPLPSNKQERVNLMAHELFHRMQPLLGFRLMEVLNTHLDKKDGRIYLRLELEALKKAAAAANTQQSIEYIKDALAFREYRHHLFPGSDSTENVLELNEGLAEYTGLMTSGRTHSEIIAHFNKSLSDFLTNPAFVRSFAYHTIPVYGYVLQKTNRHWNQQVHNGTNLRQFLYTAFHIPIAHISEPGMQVLFKKYRAASIVSEETARETRINLLIAGYKKKLLEQPHLEIPAMQMNLSFDPRNMLPVENAGTVYPTLTVSDNWGTLTATNGALINNDWTKISVSAPVVNEEKNISGDGWLLSLKNGYLVVKEEGTGNYKVVKKE